ncbi:hypothetical protein EJ06DRAFT_524303 [Trichodelitschia bisporula]|uniref:Uncharacterized protein n=1 Tax=Trichodelitschia bisporula TaxID=703511 RepID=A0A6G1HLC2_9PEZI|nr:hypothetical protein EJ06DRAFT_524303 [Trichodelitschia bisporula]
MTSLYPQQYTQPYAYHQSYRPTSLPMATTTTTPSSTTSTTRPQRPSSTRSSSSRRPLSSTSIHSTSHRVDKPKPNPSPRLAADRRRTLSAREYPSLTDHWRAMYCRDGAEEERDTRPQSWHPPTSARWSAGEGAYASASMPEPEPEIVPAAPASTHAPAVASAPARADRAWSDYMHGVVPEPAMGGTSWFLDESGEAPTLERKESKELIGMGLYDSPQSPVASTLGLKLAEGWCPPVQDEDDEEEEGMVDGGESSESEEEVEEVCGDEGMVGVDVGVGVNLAGTSFLFDEEEEGWWGTGGLVERPKMGWLVPGQEMGRVERTWGCY